MEAAVERLTTDDQLMLWPDRIWPQDIGAVAVLEGSGLLDPDGRFRLEAVEQAIGSRLHRVPRFRQLLRVPPRGLGRPLWVDAPAFDLAEHLHVLPLPGPGTEAQLLRAVEQVRRRRLDRSRPLWEMWFLPGLADGRIGAFVRIHHVLADGIAGVATVGALFDAAPTAAGTTAPRWTPAPEPTAAALFGDNVRRHLEDAWRMLSPLAHPGTGARHAHDAWTGLYGLLTEERAPATSLNRTVGPTRTLAVIRGELDQVSAIAHAHGATVNDVLLALTAGGLRGLLRSRGEPVDGLVVRVFVPVTLRGAQARRQAQGNLIGQMVVPLPVGPSDAGLRLRQIATETVRLKAESHPSLGTLLRSRVARLALLKILARNPVNVETADVPGPEHPLYLAGTRVLEIFPLLNLIGDVPLGIGALSYAGRFGVMAVADGDAFPDLDVFAAAARAELQALDASRPGGPADTTAPVAGTAGFR